MSPSRNSHQRVSFPVGPTATGASAAPSRSETLPASTPTHTRSLSPALDDEQPDTNNHALPRYAYRCARRYLANLVQSLYYNHVCMCSRAFQPYYTSRTPSSNRLNHLLSPLPHPPMRWWNILHAFAKIKSIAAICPHRANGMMVRY